MIFTTRFAAAELFMILSVWISVCVTVLSRGRPVTLSGHTSSRAASADWTPTSPSSQSHSQSPRSLKHKNQQFECAAQAPGVGVEACPLERRKKKKSRGPRKMLTKTVLQKVTRQQQALLSLCSGQGGNSHPSCDLDALPIFSYESPIASGFPGSRDSVYCGNSSRQLPRCRC